MWGLVGCFARLTQVSCSETGRRLCSYQYWPDNRKQFGDLNAGTYETMAGAGTYTTADIKARPDKQAAKWQGDGPSGLWQAVYAELDRLESCRSAP